VFFPVGPAEKMNMVWPGRPGWPGQIGPELSQIGPDGPTKFVRDSPFTFSSLFFSFSSSF
jgi:hypothetical protein